ncbi:GntR family transcriptional regulator [Frigidibacter sp. MR17.14]|uniref:GntR family transcriptional regulator n=1 Tax=Frigidibacter sp. MR17.14 TaxID=3126509 RepID=UPI003012DD07
MDAAKSLGAGQTEVPDRIERQSLHEAILTRLRDMIIEGALEPGTRINEGQIGAQLGVSRTPLREAIKYLASEGLVELVPARGAIVKKFTAKEVHDMLVVIKTLESLAAGEACRIATDAQIAAVRVLHDEMMACYARRDRLAYYKLNQQIHSAMVALADNAVLAQVHGQLQNRVKRIRFLGHEGAERWANAVAEHEQMMELLERRDAPALQEIVVAHLTRGWERVREGLVD